MIKFNFKKLRGFFLRQHALSGVIVVVTAVVVVGVLLYSNFSILNALSFFWRPDVYKNATVLFVGDGCSQCDKVDEYIKVNSISTKVQFIELEVFHNSANKRALIDKATVCGLDADHIGVPMLWDGPTSKCALGYLDVINFLKAKVAEARKNTKKP